MVVTELKQYIYENHKIDFVLEQLGCGHITYHNSKTNYYSASQPDGDSPNGINIDDTPFLAYCSYTRGVDWSDGKDLIELVEYIRKCDFKNAIEYLHSILDLPFGIQDMRPIKPIQDLKTKVLSVFTNHLSYNHAVNVADFKIYDESILDEYDSIEYIDLLHEGITPQVCRDFDIQYSYKRKRIIFPHRYWATGDIIGTNARTTIDGYDLLGINKYSFTKGFNKSCNLYGLWENYDTIQRKGYVTVFESEKSVLKRASQFDKTAVCINGKFISEEQRRILIGLNVDIILALDNDVTIEEMYCIADKFLGIRNVYYIKDTENLLDKKDAPCDKGDKIYRQLLTNKVKYDIIQHNEYVKEVNNKCIN